MASLRSLLGRNALGAGAVAAFVPAVVLLVLQYRWLTTIEQTSAVAHRANLESFVETVAADVEAHYGGIAERSLALPASVFHGDRLHRAATHFGRASRDGVASYFVVGFGADEAGTLLLYDPASERMVAPEPSDLTRALTLATSHWRLLSSKAVPFEPGPPVVDERDPAHRVILNPVTDLTARVVGVAGLVIAEEELRERILPDIVEEAKRRFFVEPVRSALVVRIRDAAGGVVSGADAAGQGEALSLPLRYVMRDWRVEVTGRDGPPEQWARSAFALNMGIALVLAAVLLSGIVLALRAASREMALSRMKADFVSNVSHELRTPLASIRMFGELLRTGRVGSPEKVREYGELIEVESRRLTALVNNILDLARIESGRKEYRFRDVDLAELLHGMLRSFELPLARQGFRLVEEVPRGPLPSVRVDPDAFGQVVQNLVDNAVKYSGDGRQVTVGIEAERGGVVLWVADQGVGIAREEQPRIFDRFHRVGSGLVHDVKGSGLGLAIVKHVVEAHGGRISVESEPGKGSCFRVHLPLARGAAMEAAVASEANVRAVLRPQER